MESKHVFEWTIKNFSCWNYELHDKVISTIEYCTSNITSVELYPRGLSGQEEHMVARLHCGQSQIFFGDLSFIGPDGSLLCTQQVESTESLDVLELPPGPKFEEVVAQIRKNETIHKDRLTLRLRERGDGERVEHMCSKIKAFDVSIKISSKIFEKTTTKPTLLSVIKYSIDEEVAFLSLKSAKGKINPSNIVLTLHPVEYNSEFLVLSRIHVLNNEDRVRTEENKNLFGDEDSWDFCDSLTLEEMEKFSLSLSFKIIPKGKYEHCLGFVQLYPGIVTRSFKSPVSSISEGSSSSSITSDSTNRPGSSVSVLTNELMCLFQDQDFSDFQLKCGDVTFPVHKNFLSARSPVFKTMLSCDMREAVSGCMDIEDLDPSTLARFLAFLYTGAVQDLEGESALKLYYAADKYQVPSLKRECVSVLRSSMSISNVCDVLSLADKHKDDELTSAAHEFFLSKFNEVLASEEWKIFMKSEPMLALETVTHFGEKKYVKRS